MQTIEIIIIKKNKPELTVVAADMIYGVFEKKNHFLSTIYDLEQIFM